MIILLKTPEDDYFVKLTEWLIHSKVKFHILNLENICLENFHIHFIDNKIKINFSDNDLNFSFEEVSTFFYRSGKILIKELKKSDISINYKVANMYYQLEQESLIDFIYSEINKKSLGFLSRNPLNKLFQINTAIEVGLKTPNTLITGNKLIISKHFKNKSIISKAIQENVFTSYNNNLYFQRVEKIECKLLPLTFSASLFQNLISKEMEIRSFYLNGIFYSLGFFCPKNTIDMRDSYKEQLHFKIDLPKKIENKLQNLMDRLGLLCGSIDLVLSENGIYYFLEVNTEGQFDWVSRLGAYNLDYKLSKYLIHRENENKINKKKGVDKNLSHIF